jgi:hypothetical protein
MIVLTMPVSLSEIALIQIHFVQATSFLLRNHWRQTEPVIEKQEDLKQHKSI